MGCELIFWLAAGLILYVYAGYPAALWLAQLIFRRPVKKSAIQPAVSLLVAAYNEATVIEAKIRNALALDYPPERLEIVIASDGSTDGTAQIARRAAAEWPGGERVRVLDYPVNRGKLAVLNDSLPQLRYDIVAFSDAASMLAPDAIRRLVASFADLEVGAVSGLYTVCKTEAAELGESEDFYWRYETFLKRQEAALGSILGAHGALYAIRKALYPFPRPGIVNDDYVIPVRILQKGFRVAYETEAVAREEAHEMSGFSRRVRIMTGNFEQLAELGALLWPPRFLPLFFFLSHKAGRLLVPAAMLALVPANLWLADRPLYLGLGCLQAAFYLLALLGAIWPLRPRILRLPYYFSMINAAAFPGLYHALSQRRRMVWKRE